MLEEIPADPLPDEEPNVDEVPDDVPNEAEEIPDEELPDVPEAKLNPGLNPLTDPDELDT